MLHLKLFKLEDHTWDEINEIAVKGNAANYFAIGDTKKVILNGAVGTLNFDNFETYVYIIGFNHNGTNNTIDFGTFKTADGVDIALVDANYSANMYNSIKNFNMNHYSPNASPYGTNHGGWAGCDFRYDILGSTDKAPSDYGSNAASGRIGYNASSTCATSPVANTLMAALPSELRNVMKPMTIYTDNIGGGTDVETNITATIDFLPLMSEFELHGSKYKANSYEQNYQKQYAYYSSGNSKIKYQHLNMSSSCRYLQRSPTYLNANGFCNSDKVAFYSSYSGGVAPIFRI